MFEARALGALSKSQVYAELDEQLRSLLAGERDFWANSANTAALLYHSLPEVNWAGFYVARRAGELVLGPFQGKPACMRISCGKGVCGAAAERRETVIVTDVNEFAGHIACDAASRSEIVVPLIKGVRLVAVLDIDSPAVGRFDGEDRAGLERLMARFVAATDGPD